jgi:anaerobic selenocysteine-containing dehydrogenase
MRGRKEEMHRSHEAWTWEEGGHQVFRSIARTGPGCHDGCGVLLYVKDGRLEKVEGDPDFPFNQGRLCPRCLALPEVVYHPDRLKYPLKRAGGRGEGKWERITWEEAYDAIVRSFTEVKKEYGPESVIFCHGTARDCNTYVSKLAYSFGSPNRVCFGPLQGHACFAPRRAAFTAALGGAVVTDCAQFFADRYENSHWKAPECIVLWGNNPLPSNPDGFLGHWVIECMKRGTEIIVVDPRKTWLATRAKTWMQIRPGTDAALALGMLNVIINEELYDKEFVRAWTHGFDELKKRVQEYGVEKVSEITWIPRDKIVEAARKYAASKPAAIQFGVPIEQTKECVPSIHAIMALWTVTGNLDVPGGNIFRSSSFEYESRLAKEYTLITEEQKNKKIGTGMYPLLDQTNYVHAVGSAVINQMETGKPYPVKAAWIQGTNTFACASADPKRVYESFKKLDFVAVVDLFMTPTATAFADIVLPAATYAERDGVATTGGNVSYIGITNQAIQPVGECKSDMEINLELGKRFNPQAWPWENVREMFSFMIRPTGMTFEDLRRRGFAYDDFEYRKYEKGLLRPDRAPGFNTPTGKVELYSTVFETCGLDPLPYFEEPPESPVSTPDIARDYPLVLTTGARTSAFFHSEHRQIPSLRRLNPDPVTEIHPETAKKLGIEDGDWIYIENKYGRCRQRAKLTPNIHPAVVNAQHGWWFPEEPEPEPSLSGAWLSNINLLLPSGWEGRSGFGYPFKSQMCRVCKTDRNP